MNHWLFKSDPGDYGYDELERDGRTVWTGVRNNQALLFLRQIKKGDQVLIYHTGDQKKIVGVAAVTKGPFADPAEENEKWVVVEIKAKRRFPHAIPLTMIKTDRAFSEFHLVRSSRLSIMPVPELLWDKILALGGL